MSFTLKREKTIVQVGQCISRTGRSVKNHRSIHPFFLPLLVRAGERLEIGKLVPPGKSVASGEYEENRESQTVPEVRDFFYENYSKKIDKGIDFRGVQFIDLESDSFEDSAKSIYRIFKLYKSAQRRDLETLQNELIKVPVPKVVEPIANSGAKGSENNIFPTTMNCFLDPFFYKTAFYPREEDPFSPWFSFLPDLDSVNADISQKIYYLCERQIPPVKHKSKQNSAEVLEAESPNETQEETQHTTQHEELYFPNKLFSAALMQKYKQKENLPGLVMEEIDEWLNVTLSRARHSIFRLSSLGNYKLSSLGKLVSDHSRRESEKRLEGLGFEPPKGETSWIGIFYQPSSYLEAALLLWVWGENVTDIGFCPCGVPFIRNIKGKPTKYCSNACKSRFWRMSKLG